MNSKKIGDPCPVCGASLVRRSGSFFWRGEYQDAAYCQKDNSIWPIKGEEIPPLRNARTEEHKP